MKNVLTICLLLLVSMLFQSWVPRPFLTTSVYVGGVNSRIIGQSDSWRDAYGLQGGLALHVIECSDIPVSILTEVNVSMQGARYEDDWGEGLVEGLTRLVYLNIPLLVRYQLPNGFFGEVGLQPGILLSAKDKYSGESYDYREWVNTFDLGIPLAVGYNFENNFGIRLRVVPGITNVNSGGDVSRDHNFLVGLGATYTLEK